MSSNDEGATKSELEELLSAEPHSVSQLQESDGTRKALGNDETYHSQTPKQDFAVVKKLGEAYKEASDEEKEQIGRKLGEFIIAWEETYNPKELGGTVQLPLDQRHFPKLFDASAVVWESLDENARNKITDLAEKTADLDKQWWEQRPTADHNNRYAYSLQLQASVASVVSLENKDFGLGLGKECLDQLEDFVEGYIGETGQTLDFIQRDSLHYHVFGLQPTFEAVLTLHNLGLDVNETAKEKLTRAVRLLDPYLTGEQEHLEFVNSQNPRDRERNPEKFNKPYQVEGNQEVTDLLKIATEALGE